MVKSAALLGLAAADVSLFALLGVAPTYQQLAPAGSRLRFAWSEHINTIFNLLQVFGNYIAFY